MVPVGGASSLFLQQHHFYLPLVLVVISRDIKEGERRFLNALTILLFSCGHSLLVQASSKLPGRQKKKRKGRKTKTTFI